MHAAIKNWLLRHYDVTTGSWSLTQNNSKTEGFRPIKPTRVIDRDMLGLLENKGVNVIRATQRPLRLIKDMQWLRNPKVNNGFPPNLVSGKHLNTLLCVWSLNVITSFNRKLCAFKGKITSLFKYYLLGNYSMYVYENCTISTWYKLNDFCKLSVVYDHPTGSYRQDNIAII